MSDEEDKLVEALPPDSGHGELAVRDLLAQLFDFEMREVITTRMLPLIYRVAIVAMAATSLLAVATAFAQSLWLGLAWLAIGPVIFLALVVVVRVTLEFVMAVFRMLVYIEILDRRTSTIEGYTDEVVQNLPRIQFWKMGKSGGLSKRREAES